MISGQSKKLNESKIKESGATIRRKQSKLSCKEDPTDWRIYRRLLDNKLVSFESLIFKEKDTDYDIADKDYGYPVFTLPDKDGLKCMCFENVMKLVENVCCCSPLHRKLIPAKPSDSWTRLCKKKYKENQDVQLPLSTVTVRWQLKRGVPGYDQSTLRSLFSRYGELREVRMLSPNSAMVVFDELTAACNVTQSHFLGYPLNKIHCRWWHRTMENKSVYFAQKRIKVKQNPFLQHL